MISKLRMIWKRTRIIDSYTDLVGVQQPSGVEATNCSGGSGGGTTTV